MPDHVHFVLSVPAAGVSDEEYDSLYEDHLNGSDFRRYWLEPASATHRPAAERRHLAISRSDGPAPSALPEWSDATALLTYGGRALEADEVRFTDEAYLVFSHPPAFFNPDQFDGWYYAHARENLTSEGFETVWRYWLTPGVADDDITGRARHGAFYECHGPLDDLHAALRDTADARRVDIPDWMADCEFFSYHCVAASSRR